MRAGFISTESARWGSVLTGIKHDFYHLPAYVRLSGHQEEGQPVAFLAEESDRKFFVPLLIRPIGHPLTSQLDDFVDATSPYGYPGPLLDAGSTETETDFLRRAVDEFVTGLRGRRIVSVFVRLHPTLALPLGPLGAVGTVVQQGETVSVDLTLSLDEMWRQTRAGHRRYIVRAERTGHVVRIDHEWAHFETFVDIYRETMLRRGAKPSYFFPPEYFMELRRFLGDRVHLCVVEIEGHVAAAALITESHGIVQYHLSGTRTDFLHHRPGKTMVHFLRGWAKEQGNQILHLGSGVGMKKDGLYAFKAGFSNIRHPMYTWRIVVDEQSYRSLVEGTNLRPLMEADDAFDFFPAYRRPIS